MEKVFAQIEGVYWRIFRNIMTRMLKGHEEGEKLKISVIKCRYSLKDIAEKLFILREM